MEIWIFYAFSAAILTAAAVITQKKTLVKEHAMEFSAVLAVSTLALSTPLFFFIDYSRLQLLPLVLLFFSSLIASTGFLLTAKSIRHMELSAVTPLLVLGPGITAIMAFIFLNETLTIGQGAGITLLILGAYVLETKNLAMPLKTFKSKYIHFIILSLILYSISAMADRVILSRLNMESIAFIAFAHLFIAFHFLIMLTFFHDGVKGINHGFKKAGGWIFLIAIFTFGYRFSQIEAIKIANVGLVTSIKRMSTLFVVVIGGQMFHEKKILRKTIASLIMIAGAVLIIT